MKKSQTDIEAIRQELRAELRAGFASLREAIDVHLSSSNSSTQLREIKDLLRMITTEIKSSVTPQMVEQIVKSAMPEIMEQKAKADALSERVAKIKKEFRDILK